MSRGTTFDAMNPFPRPTRKMLASRNMEKWVIFPESLQSAATGSTQGGKFTGYQTRYDETQNRGAFVAGQNVKMTQAQTPTLRDGSAIVGTDLLDSYPIQRAWVFETREGAQFELKTYNTGVYFWLWGTSTDWALLLGGLTAALPFGYGNIGKSSNPTSSCFFSNGKDGVWEFNGAYATFASATANTITISGSKTFTQLGFYTTGATRSIVVNGVPATYSGGEGTQTLTGVSVDFSATTGTPLIVQLPRAQEGTAPTNDLSTIQGSVMMAHDGRLHMRYDAKASVWQYSKLDDPFNFTTGSSDGDGGAKEIEFGGAINAFGKLNKTAQALKTRIIKNLVFNQFGTRVDSPQYDTLVSSDDKGTSLGATNQKSTFSTPFGLVFTTPDNRMVLLSGVTANNQPQYYFLSDPVAEVFTQGVHTQATGICVDNRIYYSFRQNAQSTYNDVEIQGNMLRQSFDAQGRAIPIFWDTPNVGVNCNDYTAVYNATNQKYEVHRHSSLNSNTYAVIETKTDDNQAFTGIVRTWGETFGEPDSQKYIDYVMVEIKMLANTLMTATVLFDQDGASGQQSFTLSGADTANLIQTSSYNPFGASPYGRQKIGSNAQQDQLKRYIYWLELNPNQEFFSVALQLSTDTENSDFELIRFGYRLVRFIEVDLPFKKNTN